MSRRRTARLTLAVAIVAGVASQPGVALADAAGPSDWRTEIRSVSPATEAISVSIEGGDSFVRAVVDPGHELVVLGYVGEPYLRIDADGRVFENRNSTATYLNRTRDGLTVPPTGLDTEAAPDWVRIGGGGRWAWHDHRAHWMGGPPPDDMRPGDSLPPEVVPLEVDGVRIDVEVVSTLVARPAWWPSVLVAAGVLVLLTGLVAAAARRLASDRLRLGGAVVMLAVAVSATVVGAVQYRSLSPETGPQWTWWAMPLIATVCAGGLIVLGWRRRAPLVAVGLALVGGAQLVIWGWMRRTAITRGVLPTDAPYLLDRSVTAAALIAGAVLLVAEIGVLSRWLRQPPAAAIAASSSD